MNIDKPTRAFTCAAMAEWLEHGEGMDLQVSQSGTEIRFAIRSDPPRRLLVGLDFAESRLALSRMDPETAEFAGRSLMRSAIKTLRRRTEGP